MAAYIKTVSAMQQQAVGRSREARRDSASCYRRAATGEWQFLADSGFTTVQVRCWPSARWLTFKRATKVRAEGLGLLASTSISAPSVHRARASSGPSPAFKCRQAARALQGHWWKDLRHEPQALRNRESHPLALGHHLRVRRQVVRLGRGWRYR